MLPITTFRAGIISILRVLFPLSPNSTLLFFIYYDHRCLYSNPQPPAVSFRKILKQYIPIVAPRPSKKNQPHSNQKCKYYIFKHVT